MEGDRERFVAMGMTDYLAKPLDRRLLLNKVHTATAQSRTPETAATAESSAPSQGPASGEIDLSDVLSAIDIAAA
jgi:DNA-binding response OmpR family regulator